MTVFVHEVKIPDNGSLLRTYEEIDWLKSEKLEPHIDWDIDMHGGEGGFTSFFFKDKDHAMLFKLTRGGA